MDALAFDKSIPGGVRALGRLVCRGQPASCMPLGFYTYIAYRVTPLLFLLFIPFFKTRPGFWKRVLVFIVAAFIVAAPIGWYFVKHPADFFGRTSEIAVTNAQARSSISP